MKKIITAVLLAMVLSVILTACENTESYMIVSPNDNTRGVDLVMERTTTGSAATGNLTISEGERLVINPNMEKGRVAVSVYWGETSPNGNDTDSETDAVLEKTIGGKDIMSYGLEPGDYTIVFIAKNRPTGTLMVLPYDTKEVRSQEDTLKEKLDDMRISMEEDSGE